MTAASGPEDRRRSIADSLRRMNAETSSRLSALAAPGGARVRTGRTRMLASACVAFARSYFASKNMFRGKEGLILSCTAALEAILQAVKVWELEVRRREGAEHLPPSNETEVRKLSARYASWTGS